MALQFEPQERKRVHLDLVMNLAYVIVLIGPFIYVTNEPLLIIHASNVSNQAGIHHVQDHKLMCYQE